MTYAIHVTLEGSEEEVRSRLDGLLSVLHEFALFVDATPRGAALTAGRVDGMFDETRWSAMCKRLQAGTTRSACINRNTSDPGAGLFSEVDEGGLNHVHCWLWLGDDTMGTRIDMVFWGDDDAAISADEFRGWVDRIERASGMRRTEFSEEEVIAEVFEVDLDGFDVQGAIDGFYEELAESSSAVQPTEVNGVLISGWEKLQEEMEVIIVPAVRLDAEGCATVEQTLEGWVDHGTEVGYGDGAFHGWIPGEWESDRYYLSVDSGSQSIDWYAAIADLAARLSELRVVGSPLRIELGPETE